MKSGVASGLRGIFALALLSGAAPTRAQAPPNPSVTSVEKEEPKIAAMRIAAIFGSSFSTLVTEGFGGACARVGAAPDRSASAKMPRNPLATPDFMFPFAQTKGSTAALPALSTLAVSCNLAGASAVPVGAVPFVNDSLQEKYSRQMLFAGIGPQGQQRLLSSRAAIVGC